MLRERSRVRACDDVPHRDAALRLLKREVAQVTEKERELLLVVRTPFRLVGALDEDDSELAGWLPGQRTDRVRELVVRNEQPAPCVTTRLEGSKCFAEPTHAAGPSRPRGGRYSPT